MSAATIAEFEGDVTTTTLDCRTSLLHSSKSDDPSPGDVEPAVPQPSPCALADQAVAPEPTLGVSPSSPSSPEVHTSQPALSRSPPPKPAPVRLPLHPMRADEQDMSAVLPPSHPGMMAGGGCPFLSASALGSGSGNSSASSSTSWPSPNGASVHSAGSSPGSPSVYTPTSIRVAMDAAAQNSSGVLPMPKDHLSAREIDTMLHMLPDALFTVDYDGIVRDLNSKACAMFGYARSSLLGQSINQLLPAHLRAGHDAQMKGAFHLNTVREMGRRRTVRGLHADGSQLELSIHLSPFRLVNLDEPPECRAERGTSLMLCVVRDITERTRLAMSRQRAANRARMMTEFLRLLNHETRTSMHAIHHSLADLHAEIESVCQSMQEGGRWADDTPQSPPQQSLFDPMPPAGQTPQLSSPALQLPSPLATHQQLFLMAQANGLQTEESTPAASISPMTPMQLPAVAIVLPDTPAAVDAPMGPEAQAAPDAMHSPAGVQLPPAGQLSDVDGSTDFIHADHTSERFASAVSNSLDRSSSCISLPRAPQLATSVARSASVASGCGSSASTSRVPPGLRTRLECVESATERIGTLLGNAVDLQNLQSGNIVNQITSFHPPALLQTLVDSKSKQAAAAQVRLRVCAPVELPTVKGNAQLLLKCLAALVDNAIKASHPGGRVVLRCHATQDRALMQTSMAAGAGVLASLAVADPPQPTHNQVHQQTQPGLVDAALPVLPPMVVAVSSPSEDVPSGCSAAAERVLSPPKDITPPDDSRLPAAARANLLSGACASPHPVYRSLLGAKKAALAAAAARAAAQATNAATIATADQLLPTAMAAMSVDTSADSAPARPHSEDAPHPSLTVDPLRSTHSPGKLRRSPRVQSYDEETNAAMGLSPLSQARSGRVPKPGARDVACGVASTADAPSAAPASEGLVLELCFQVLDDGVGFGGVELERLTAPQSRLRRSPEDDNPTTLSDSESENDAMEMTEGLDVSSTRSTNGGLGLGILIARLAARGLSGSFQIRSAPRGNQGAMQAAAPDSSSAASGEGEAGAGSKSCSCDRYPPTAGANISLCSFCLQSGRWSSVCELLAPFAWSPPHLLLDAPQQQRILRHLFSPSLAATRAAFPVLVVDDSTVNSKILVKLLHKRGFTSVVTAADGQLALQAVEARRTAVAMANAQRRAQRADAELESEDFALILMDCEMPVMDGFSCTRALRGAGCTTPIVALTANATFACQRRCYECGFDIFLNKPLKSDALFFTVAALPPFKAYPLALSPFFMHQ